MGMGKPFDGFLSYFTSRLMWDAVYGLDECTLEVIYDEFFLKISWCWGCEGFIKILRDIFDRKQEI